MLEFRSVFKSYSGQMEEIPVVRDVSFTVKSGEFIAIIGPSGSGKSTLLGLAAGLDRSDRGEIILDGQNLTNMAEDELAEIRSSKIGFIFQNFQLLPNLTAWENVAIPLMISSNLSEKEIRSKSLHFLKLVSMMHRSTHFPQQLSGGEEQRVAIARSFVNDPMILFADEPTANLDSKNGAIVMELLKDLNQEKGSTLIVVTHDPSVARLADRVFEMKDGRLWEQSRAIKPAKKKSASKKKKSSAKRTKTIS